MLLWSRLLLVRSNSTSGTKAEISSVVAETRAPNAQVAVGRRRASRVPIKATTAPCTKSTSLSGIIALPLAAPDQRLVAIMLHVALGGNRGVAAGRLTTRRLRRAHPRPLNLPDLIAVHESGS